MGREVRRVPADFDWSVNKRWEGFVNPWTKFSRNCPFCDGSGHNEETKKLEDTWYDLDNPTRENAWYDKITQDEVDALIKHSRLMDFTHILTEKGWKKKDPPYALTAEEVNQWARQPRAFGHDGINRWICIETRAKRLGVWGKCEFCHGDGVVWLKKAYREKAENWKKKQPPKGRCYQIWETVSEGSPISPVFVKPEDLATWMAEHPWSKLDEGNTKEDWMKFIMGPGWAVSMVKKDGVMMSGVKVGVQ